MTAQSAEDPLDGFHDRVGCVLGRDDGVVSVLTDAGTVRATFGPRMLARIAQTRADAPEPGEWVSLYRWPDGVLTVQACLGRRTRTALAPVIALRPRRA